MEAVEKAEAVEAEPGHGMVVSFVLNSVFTDMLKFFVFHMKLIFKKLFLNYFLLFFPTFLYAFYYYRICFIFLT